MNLQNLDLDEEGLPSTSEQGEAMNSAGLVLEWLYGLILSDATAIRRAANAMPGSLATPFVVTKASELLIQDPSTRYSLHWIFLARLLQLIA